MTASIRFTNTRGEPILFSDDFPYMFLNIDGLGGTDANLQTQRAPFIDGAMYVDSTLDVKPMSIEVAIKSRDAEELTKMRREISRVFNPKLGEGTLEFIENDVVKEITCVAENSPFFPIGSGNQSEYIQRVLIDVIALDPYWKDPNKTSQQLQSYVGNFQFPVIFPFELGVAGSETELYNEGDEPTPVQIEINGPTTNPQIHNRTTGEYIRIERDISHDETLYIDTAPGRKSVVIIDGNNNEEQAFGYLDHNSDLFKLEIGTNKIEHVADAGNPDSTVVLTWQSRYVGI